MDDFYKSLKLFFICLFYSAFIYGQDSSIPQEFSGKNVLNTPIIVDGKEVEYWWISPQGKNILLKKEDFLNLSKNYLEKENQNKLIKKFRKKNIISSQELKENGISLKFDENDLIVQVAFDLANRKESHMNLSPISAEISEQDFLPAFSSGHLSFNIDQDFEGQDDDFKSTTRQGNLLFFQNFGGVAIESGVDYSNSREKQYARDQSLITLDRINRQERYQVGDQNISTTGFQTSPSSLSASVTKSLNLRPSTFIRSSQMTQVNLKRRSTVEVYVNNILIERRYLPPGPVKIDNFPFSSGFNQILIRIIDDKGEIEEFNYNTLYNQQLIAKGLSEYHYSINTPSDFVDGIRSYDYKDSYLSSYIQYGLTHKDNIGGALQAGDNHYQGGALWGRATPIGLVQVEPFISLKDDHVAHAERLTIQSNEIFQNKILPYNLRLSAEKRGFHFSQLGIQNQSIKELVDFYSNIRVTNKFGLGLGFRRNNNFGNTKSDVLRLNFNFNLMSNLTTGLNISKTVNGTIEDVYLWTLNWTPFNSTIQNFSSYDSSQDIFRTQVNLNKNSGVHRMGGLVSYTDQPSSKDINSQAIYRNQRLSSRIDHTQTQLKSNNQRSHQTRFNFGSGIVWSKHKLALSRPLNSSFALIDTSEKSNDSIPIGYGNDVYQAEINQWGPGVIPNVQPHYRYRQSLDTVNIPDGMSLKFEDFSFTTTYKRGTLIEVPVEGKLSVQAQLLDFKNQPLVLRTGSVFDKNQQLISRFFTNRDGGIFLEDLVNGDYILVIDSNAQKRLESLTYQIHVQKDGFGFIHLKSLKPVEN